jgi:hypothetical protein
LPWLLAAGWCSAMIDDRSDRERHAESQRRSNLWLPGTAISSARQLVQVYDGGSLPTAADKVYLTHPAVLDADDTEGATWTGAVDSGVTIPVVVLGSAPDAGDYLVAHAVGGRWFAEKANSVILSCSPCGIPKNDLTISYINPIIGNGSWTLIYTAPDTWISVCTNGLTAQLSCLTNVLVFKVCWYSGGLDCSGSQTCCSSSISPPFSLVLSTYTCDPLFLKYTTGPSSCTALFGSGYVSFTITDP